MKVESYAMLKSVSLDNKEHAHLIKFIQNYRDENGNNNISSAIRYLMQKGYEALYQSISSSNTVDIKKEILNDVLSEINNKLLDKLLNTNPQQIPVYINPANMIMQPMLQQQNIPMQNYSNNLLSEKVNNEYAKTDVKVDTKIDTKADTKISSIVHEVKPTKDIKKKSSNSFLNNLLSNASR